MSKHNKYAPAQATSPREVEVSTRKPTEEAQHRNVEPDPLTQAYVIRRDREGWTLLVADIPRDVYELYARTRYEPDVLPHVVSRVAQDIERRAMGLAK